MRIPYRRTYLPFSLMILALGGLYAASAYNYDLFLSLAGLFSIAIALGIFILVWTSRNHLDNNYLLFIGIAYLFIGGMQMAHTLALQSVYGYGDNTAEHLWVATRYVESLTFLAAPLFIAHKLRPRSVFLAYAVITPVLLMTVILWNLSAVANAGGGGKALFTDTSQYIIAMIFASAILLLLQKRQHFNSSVLRLLITAMAITASVGVVSAVVKTNEEAVHMAAHLAQLVSLGFIFQAVVDAGLTRPYQLILRDLNQNREALRHERDTAQKYLDVAGVIFVAKDINGKVTMINKKGCEVLGYQEDKIMGKDWLDNFIPPRLRDEVRSVTRRLLGGETEATEYYESPVLTRSREERIIAWHNVLLKDETDNIIGHLSSGEDITERKRTEEALRESEEELRRMFASVTDGIVVTSLDGIITDANEKAIQMYGCNTTRELIGANSLKLVDPTDLPKVMADMKDVLDTGSDTGIEYGITRKDGSRFPSEASTSLLKDASGNPAGFISVIRDVTEQKQAEEKLQESEARYRALFETKLEGTIVINETMRIVLANQAIADMLGFDSIEELYEINLLDYIMPEFQEWAAEHITVGLFQEDRRGLYEIRCMKKNGDEIWIGVTGIRTEHNGQPIGIISARDITDRKRMAEAIAKNAQRYRSLFENMPAGFIYGKIITDENDKPVDALCLEVNDSIEGLTGIKKEQLIGRRLTEIMPTLTESNPDLFDVLGEVAATGESARTEDYFEPLDKWLASSIYSPEKGYFTALFEDITERKQTEEIFRTVSLRSPAGMYVVQDGKFVFANPRFLVNKGITEEKLLGTESLDLVHPEDRERVRQDVIAMLKGERTTPYEYRIINENGEVYAWLSETVVSIQYQGRRAVLGNVVDITEQKQANEQLRQSEENLRTYLESAPDAVYINDLNGTFLYGNQKAEQLTGYTREELIGKSFLNLNLLPEEYYEIAAKQLTLSAAGKPTGPDEFELRRKDGSLVWTEINTTPVRQGEQLVVVGFVRDITERKQTEEIFRTVSLRSPAGMYVVQDGKFVFANPRFSQEGDLAENELLGTESLSRVHPDDREMVRQDAIAMLKGERTTPYEYRIINENGEVYAWLSETVTSIQYQGRRAVLGNVVDITEQKQAEEIFQTISMSSPTSIYIVQDGKFVFANPRLLNRVSYTEDGLSGMEPKDLVHPEDREMARQGAVDMLKGIRTTPYEYRALTNTGEMLWVAETVASIQYQGRRAVLGSILDITERKQAEEIFQTIALSSPASIYILQDGKFVFNNTQFLNTAGFSEDEIRNTDPQDLIHPEDREMVRQNAIEMLKGIRTTPYEYRSLNKNGEIVWVTETLASIQYQGRRAILGSALNNTERKQAEEIFQTVSLSSPAGMYIIQDGKFIFANPQFASDVGWTEDELLGADSLDSVRPEDTEMVRRNAIEMLKGIRTTPYEYGITNSAGETRWLMETVAPIQYRGKRAVLGNVLDITERKQNEERLRETRRRFRDLVNLLPLGVTEIDTNGNVTFANRKAIDDSDYTEEELRAAPSKPYSTFIPEDRERVRENVQRILNGEILGRVEYTMQMRDGSTYPVTTYSAPIIQDGKAVGLRTVTVDITEQKKAEQEIAEKNRALEEVNAQLQEVDRLKSIFLSSMSHELRTPLNSIIGFTSLILDGMTGDINEEQREQLALVKSSSHHLLSLINDVLDISKIEAGMVELALEEFPLNELVSEVVELLTPTAQMKGIELSAETDGDIHVCTDRRRFKQVLINLGGNAVKFTEQGSVRIIAGLHKKNGHIQDGSLEVHVIDTGIGIKKEDIGKLFAPFQQVDGSLTRRFEGTGLGLHHSKKILTMLGGNIWIKSKYGKGSDFVLTLPLTYKGDEDNEESTGSG